MDAELVVNSFWFLTILTAVLYIAKKRSKKKKHFNIINLTFRTCFFISLCLIIVSLCLLILKS